MKVRAKGILVLVWIIAILGVLFFWTCNTQAGGGGGDTKPKVVEPVQSVFEEPVQHTEEEPVHTDLPGHDVEHIVLDWRHVETWKLVTGLITAVGGLAALIYGGIRAVQALTAKKE